MKMKPALVALLGLSGWLFTLSVPAAALAIIPAPQKMEVHDGVFNLTAKTRVCTDEPSRTTGEYLARQLRQATGYAVELAAGKPGSADILLTTQDASAALGDEGYELNVTPNSAIIRATSQAGMFYGAQTLLQLLPPAIFSSTVAAKMDWPIPCVHIKDRPRFPWRGLMLDVSRHFFNVAEVKRYLDLMALHKLNTFHWHLVDDSGWRIEIKKYPKLTRVGAWRDGVGFGLATNSTTAYGPDGRYGGFYTQDDIREVVAYAAARHITIVPEIEMPGHSLAALAAYPEFGSGPGPFVVPLKGGVNPGIYSPAKAGTFEFLENVLTEVFALFPSRYIHIGGDEVPKGPWKNDAECQALMQREGLKNEEELQGWFIRRIEKFINARSRTLLGWSEILQGGLAQNAAVMDWIGGGREAANAGHDVVMSPTGFCYFDYCQSQATALEPRAIGGFLPLEKVYAFEPLPEGLLPDQAAHVLGCQGNLWTEYIASLPHVEYMTFPRACALAEVGWSPKAGRNWDDFSRRLRTHEQRLDHLGVNYRPDNAVTIGEWSPSQIRTQFVTLEWDATAAITEIGKLFFSLNYSKGGHGIRIESVTLLEDGREIAADVHDGFAGGRPRKPVYELNLPACKTGARYQLQARVAGDGGTDSSGVVVLERRATKAGAP